MGMEKHISPPPPSLKINKLIIHYISFQYIGRVVLQRKPMHLGYFLMCQMQGSSLLC